jgi:hypothetical protein
VLGVASGDALPKKVLIRSRRGRRTPRIATFRWDQAEEPYVKASVELFDAIKRQQHVDEPQAELKRLSRIEWVRYDADTRANVATAVATMRRVVRRRVGCTGVELPHGREDVQHTSRGAATYWRIARAPALPTRQRRKTLTRSADDTRRRKPTCSLTRAPVV